MRTVVPTTDYAAYTAAWDAVTSSGRRQWNLDTRAGHHRYLSLVALSLTNAEAAQLRLVTAQFSHLLDRAVDGILEDPDWWSALAWPWPAIELARQEPPHPGGIASLFGRFDCLLDTNGDWQVIEYNADTPSGGREASGLEPAIARLHPRLRRVATRLSLSVARTLGDRVKAHCGSTGLVGIVSSHSWVEDMAQAHWLAALLREQGLDVLVGDVTDLQIERNWITLRACRINALYRFYPIERLYRHSIFARLCEASVNGRLLMLNGLRGFLAQSKACLAWLWSNKDDCPTIERHLPETILARDQTAAALLQEGVVKHVNGREGDSVVFGNALDSAAWEARLLEGGYVVQRTVHAPGLTDVELDDARRTVRCIGQRVACVGGFAVGGQFAGCYTRLDGPITSPRATFAATLRELT